MHFCTYQADAGSDVLTAVVMENPVFWDINALCFKHYAIKHMWEWRYSSTILNLETRRR
jgi:hypothetical protein